MPRKLIRSHRELEVYQMAFEASMRIFGLTKSFPGEERYSLTDQIRRSSRSVCANLAEAWRKRRYEGAFLIKLSDSEAEAAETQTWLEFAVKCNYLEAEPGRKLYQTYDQILAPIILADHFNRKQSIKDGLLRRQISQHDQQPFTLAHDKEKAIKHQEAV